MQQGSISQAGRGHGRGEGEPLQLRGGSGESNEEALHDSGMEIWRKYDLGSLFPSPYPVGKAEGGSGTGYPSGQQVSRGSWLSHRSLLCQVMDVEDKEARRCAARLGLPLSLLGGNEVWGGGEQPAGSAELASECFSPGEAGARESLAKRRAGHHSPAPLGSCLWGVNQHTPAPLPGCAASASCPAAGVDAASAPKDASHLGGTIGGTIGSDIPLSGAEKGSAPRSSSPSDDATTILFETVEALQRNLVATAQVWGV